MGGPGSKGNEILGKYMVAEEGKRGSRGPRIRWWSTVPLGPDTGPGPVAGPPEGAPVAGVVVPVYTQVTGVHVSGALRPPTPSFHLLRLVLHPPLSL